MNDPNLNDPRDLMALLEDSPYLDDVGFTARVMRQLPARKERRLQARGLVPAMALAACAGAYAIARSGSAGAAHVAHPGAMSMGFLGMMLALVVTAGVVVVPEE